MSQLWSGSHIGRAHSVGTPGSQRTLESVGGGGFKRAFTPWLCSGKDFEEEGKTESVSTNVWDGLQNQKKKNQNSLTPLCLTLFIWFISHFLFPGVQLVESGSLFCCCLFYFTGQKVLNLLPLFMIQRLGMREVWWSQSSCRKIRFTFSLASLKFIQLIFLCNPSKKKKKRHKNTFVQKWNHSSRYFCTHGHDLVKKSTISDLVWSI